MKHSTPPPPLWGKGKLWYIFRIMPCNNSKQVYMIYTANLCSRDVDAAWDFMSSVKASRSAYIRCVARRIKAWCPRSLRLKVSADPHTIRDSHNQRFNSHNQVFTHTPLIILIVQRPGLMQTTSVMFGSAGPAKMWPSFLSYKAHTCEKLGSVLSP